jgi:nicotinate-nucleotide pyrophosphorylase (carboxylating)
MDVFDLPAVNALIEAALAEDIGRGDLTTRLTVGDDVPAQGRLLAKQAGVAAGLPLVGKIFAALAGPAVAVQLHLDDGESFDAGTVLAFLSGPASFLLAGERVALNFLQRLSGVATLTRRYVQAVAGTRAHIVDTRKTTPGLRVLEKYAVRVGGGHNHRMGLDDGVLIKDNHIVAAGGVATAVKRAREGAPHTATVEVECTTLEEVEEALGAGATVVLLDNMTPEQLAAAVRVIAGRALVEASGGVTLETVRAVAESGVDLISVGGLTHSAPAVDLSMRVALG